MQESRMYIMLHPKKGNCSGHARLTQKGMRAAISLSISNLDKKPYRAMLLSQAPASAIVDLGSLLVSGLGQGRLAQDSFALPNGTTLNEFRCLIICTDWPDTQVYAAGAVQGQTLMPLWQMQEAVQNYLAVPPKEEAKPAPEPIVEPGPEIASPPEQKPEPAEEIIYQPMETDAIPLDALPPVYWPNAIEELKIYFDTLMPFAPFENPGWRFVKVPLEGPAPASYCAIGIYIEDYKVTKVLYALPGIQGTLPPPGLKGYRFQTGRHGQGYWTLAQNAVLSS